ncbi:hypothetical protein EAH80_22040 [Mycobacterium hodleri]|uniref:Uncharacterized protein n=1 Tax=Mycolicibacterium hodleri TaxID=49897 RepID=A0A502E3C6_9MYCO|nr:hypothetical protein EAH80_22040 [Mycolicibacterium hodleri]
MRAITPASAFVAAFDGEADALDRLSGPSDLALMECLEGVVDRGLADDEPVAADSGVDESVDAEEVDVDDSSAQASPGALTIAPPTPRATAKAPTRPMCFE